MKIKRLNESYPSSCYAVYALDNDTGIEYCAGAYETARDAHYWMGMDRLADREYGYGNFTYRMEQCAEFTTEMAKSSYELNNVKLANYDKANLNEDVDPLANHNWTMYSISNREIEQKATAMVKDLAREGFLPVDSKYTGSKYYVICRKRDENGRGIWKAVQYNNQLEPRVIDITYDQATGRAPMDDFDGLRRDLGKMLLPQNEGVESTPSTTVDNEILKMVENTLSKMSYAGIKSMEFFDRNGQRFLDISISRNADWFDYMCYKKELKQAFKDVYTNVDDNCLLVDVTEFYKNTTSLEEASNKNFYVTVYARDSKSGPEEGGYVTYGWDAISSKSFRDEESAKRYQKDFVDGAEILSDDGNGCLEIRDEWEDEYKVCIEPAHRRGKANAPARSWAESELDIKPARPYFDRQGKRVAENPRVTLKRERERVALNKEFEDRLNSAQTRDEFIDIITDMKYRSIRDDHYELMGATAKRLTEAKYGGAFDVADDQFFTREDVNSAAEEVLAHVQETFNGKFVLAGCWFEHGTFIVNIQDDNFNEYEAFAHVSMRRIRKPEDLKKYALDIASKIIKQIKEDKGMDECKLNETSMAQLDQRRKDLYGRIRNRLGTDNLISTRGQWTQEEVDENVELSTISMIQSICAYANGVPTVDEVMENRYMKDYIGQLGKEKVRAIVERELEHFSRAKVKYAHTDSEGVSYNTIEYPEDRMNEATYPRHFKLGENDIQYVKVYNQYGYTIQEIRIDNANKTFERGNFSIGHDKAYKNRQVYEDFIEELKAQGYTEIPSDYRCLRNKTRKGVPMTEGDMPTATNSTPNYMVKDWYIDKYPSDELGNEINDRLTFGDVYAALERFDDIYEVIGVNDSIVRERIFTELARRMKVDYDKIYYMWIDSDDGLLESDDLDDEVPTEQLTEDYDEYGSWSVEFDLTLEGEEVRFDDLDEVTQEHIAECIKDGVVQGEICADDGCTGWWVAKIECYLDDKGDVLFDSLDECSQEHIADSIKDGYTSGELCVTREELTEAPVVKLSGDDLNNPNEVDFKKIIKKAQDEEDERARQAEYTRRKKEATEKYAGLLDDVANALNTMEDKTDVLYVLGDALVPPQGKADTVAGEIVRAMMKVVYRYYNDGDYYFMGYGLETAAPAIAYLENRYEDIISDVDTIAKKYTDYLDDKELEKSYENFLNDMIVAIVEDIQEHPELLAEPNEDDYLKTDADHIADAQPLFSYDFMLSYEIRELYDADLISRRDIEEYAEEAFNWESVYDGVEVSVDGDYVYVEDLTYDGLVALQDRLSNRRGRDGIDNFWAELLEQNQDAYDRLQNGDDEEDEDYEDNDEDGDFDPDDRRDEKPWDYGKHFDESLDDEYDEDEDKPFTYEQTLEALKELTHNFTDESGEVKCFFRQEKDDGRDILKHYYRVVDVSDGRRFEGEPMCYVLAFSERDE